MKNKVKILERLGQTQSVHQHSNDQLYTDSVTQNHAFIQLKAQNHDLVCMILPDDDDEE